MNLCPLLFRLVTRGTLVLLGCFIPVSLLAGPASVEGSGKRYAVALSPTPVLNTPDFRGVFGGQDGKSLRTDGCGQIRALEFVALAGTPFHIEATLDRGGYTVYRVTTADYPYPAETGYFIDSRRVTVTDAEPPPRPRTLPPREEIIRRLLAAQGSRYVWGGNVRAGVPELLGNFPPPSGADLDPSTASLWQLEGLDCSGLLYEATEGSTPRNTSALVTFGRGVPVTGLSAAAVARRVEPLDLIVWPGHVLIVIDRERVIESRLDCRGKNGGVRVRPLLTAVAEIMEKRRPVDIEPAEARQGKQGFVIRRWYPPGTSLPVKRPIASRVSSVRR